jgi:hypothetical protein
LIGVRVFTCKKKTTRQKMMPSVDGAAVLLYCCFGREKSEVSASSLLGANPRKLNEQTRVRFERDRFYLTEIQRIFKYQNNGKS